MISRVARVAGVGLLVASLAACTGGDANDGPSPDAVASPTDSAGSPTDEPSPAMPEPREPGAIEEYLGYVDVVRSAEEWVAHITTRENLIAACMTEQGFEYTPQVPNVDQIVYLDGPVQGSREFVESWGYGVWDQPPNGGGGGFMYTGGADPNHERREAMTEAGREAYDTARLGPVIATGDDGSISREGGCYDVAEGWAAAGDPYLDGVRDEAQAFLETIGDDSRFGEVDAAWASCMADAGFGYRTPAEAQQQFMDEMLLEIEDGTLDRDAVTEHAPEEVRVAVADLDCQEATDWAARHWAIEIEIQQEYVDNHLADLEALAAAMESRPAD